MTNEVEETNVFLTGMPMQRQNLAQSLRVSGNWKRKNWNVRKAAGGSGRLGW